MRILIPGVAGRIAQKLARRLLARGHQVAGLDVRPWIGAPPDLELHVVDIRKRAAEDVFRRFRPHAVVHMATVSAFAVAGEERYRINLGGTRAVFEHCKAWGVEHVVFMGRHTFYGAAPDSVLYHREDEPPLALGSYPELADLVAADLYAANAIWRARSFSTTVMRVVYTLGPSGQGTLAAFLRGRAVPMLLGFDPLFQFIHEDDVVDALLLVLEKRPPGVFNLAGPQPVPLSVIAREAGRRVLPLPEFVVRLALGRGGLPRLAAGALTHIKYPVVVDPSAFREATGFRHQHDEVETIRSFREAFPPAR